MNILKKPNTLICVRLFIILVDNRLLTFANTFTLIYWFPRIIGNPPSPLPITITFALGDSDNLSVASIPFSCRILSVSDALKIRLAVAFPSASIR